MVNSLRSRLLHFGILTLVGNFLSACTQSDNTSGLHITKQDELVILLKKIISIKDLSDTDEVARVFHLYPTPKLQTTLHFNSILVRYYNIYNNRPLELGSNNTVDYEARDSKSLSPDQRKESKHRGIVSLRFDGSELCIKKDFLESMWGEGKPMFITPTASTAVYPAASKPFNLDEAILIPISLKQVIKTENQPFGFTWEVLDPNDGNPKIVRAGNIDQECFSEVYFTQSDPDN